MSVIYTDQSVNVVVDSTDLVSWQIVEFDDNGDEQAIRAGAVRVPGVWRFETADQLRQILVGRRIVPDFEASLPGAYSSTVRQGDLSADFREWFELSGPILADGLAK